LNGKKSMTDFEDGGGLPWLVIPAQAGIQLRRTWLAR
jgi:hypothetical protein